MCGIVATLGNKPALPFLLEGLQNLEYRGYDSAGLTLLHNGKSQTQKAVGQVQNLVVQTQKSQLKGFLGIGHTRWATHGQVSIKNTHPHTDAKQQFFVVHNGIIENHATIKEFLLEKGYQFSSETDTEVIPQLLAYNFAQTQDVRSAILLTLQTLKGAYALAIVAQSQPQKLWGAKLSGPLILGLGQGAYFLASDPQVLAEHAQEIIILEDKELVEISLDGYTITDIDNERKVQRPPELLNLVNAESKLQGFPDFMSQEIAAIPQTIENVIRGRLNLEKNLIKLGGLDLVRNQLQHINRLLIIACGSSYFAGLVGEYLFEEIANIPTEVQLASEFRYRKEPLSRDTALIVISQSGETADTIAALKKVEDSGILKLGVVNVVGSTINRLTDAGVHCRAGVEKSVAATKSFIAQITVLILMALDLGRHYPAYRQTLEALVELPQKMRHFLATNQVAGIAQEYSQSANFLFLGRRYLFPLALEGALKLKELSYVHAEGLAAGEIKHGSLALIDEGFPTFAFALKSDISEKMINNLAEIKARKGPIIAVVDQPNSSLDKLADAQILVPQTLEVLQPLVAGLACHIFAYEIAKSLKRPIDRPRNLAKSVTVE